MERVTTQDSSHIDQRFTCSFDLWGCPGGSVPVFVQHLVGMFSVELLILSVAAFCLRIIVFFSRGVFFVHVWIEGAGRRILQ